MANPIETPTPRAQFAPIPRRRGLAAAAVVALWVSLCGAFAVEILPIGSPVDRLYELEAARDRFERAAQARGALAAHDAADSGSRVAGRAAHPRRRTSQSTKLRTIDTRIDVASGM
jgi:hypothetical protein